MSLTKNFNKTLFFTITLVVGGFLFIAIIEKVGFEKIIKTVLTFQLRYFIIIIFLNFIAFIVSTVRWKIILDATGNNIRFNKVFAAKMIGYSINYLTPSGLILGEPFKAMLLSEKTKISAGSAMASIVIEGSIFLSTFLLFIIIGIFAFFSHSNTSTETLFVVIGALIFLLSLFCLFFIKMIKPSDTTNDKGFFTYLIDLLHLHKISFIDKLKNRIIHRENEIKNFFQLHKKTVFAAILLSVFELAITLIASWLTLYFLGLTIGIKALLGLFSLMSISYLIPLPGSLGGMELSQVFAFSFFGLGGQTTALAFALITRLVSLASVLIGIGFLVQFEINTISKKTVNFLNKLKQNFRGLLQSL